MKRSPVANASLLIALLGIAASLAALILGTLLVALLIVVEH